MILFLIIPPWFNQLTATAIIIPCLTAMTAAYGRADQKGAVMGTLRSLGALARVFGPFFSSFRNFP